MMWHGQNPAPDRFTVRARFLSLTVGPSALTIEYGGYGQGGVMRWLWQQRASHQGARPRGLLDL